MGQPRVLKTKLLARLDRGAYNEFGKYGEPVTVLCVSKSLSQAVFIQRLKASSPHVVPRTIAFHHFGLRIPC